MTPNTGHWKDANAGKQQGDAGTPKGQKLLGFSKRIEVSALKNGNGNYCQIKNPKTIKNFTPWKYMMVLPELSERQEPPCTMNARNSPEWQAWKVQLRTAKATGNRGNTAKASAKADAWPEWSGAVAQDAEIFGNSNLIRNCTLLESNMRNPALLMSWSRWARTISVRTKKGTPSKQ